MKQFLRFTLGSILLALFGHSSAQAQFPPLPGDIGDTVHSPAIAFEKADRSKIFIKVIGGSVDSIDFAAIDPTDIDSVRQLAILGMTPDESRLLIGATVGYLSPGNGQHVAYSGLFNIVPKPGANALFFHQIVPLLASSGGGLNFRPEGVLSPDGSQWWAVLRSKSEGQGPLRFYHGSLSGGTVDSVEVTAAQTGGQSALENGYHISNLTIDKKNGTMLAVSMDRLQDETSGGRAVLYNWTAPGQLFGIDFSGALKNLRGKLFWLDTVFGLSVNALGDGSNVEIGLTPQANNTIDFYKSRYQATNVDLNSVSRSIDRSEIPSNENFFAGGNCGKYNETVGASWQLGNGGDLIFNSDGSKALFITRADPDSCKNRGLRSGIYETDFSTATLIYNDSNAQELQPVYVTWPYAVPHVAGLSSSAPSLNFGSHDTATSTTMTITITDTSNFVGTIIDSIRLKNHTDFSVTGPTMPYTMMHNGSATFQITFNPVGAAGNRTDSLIIKSARSTNSTLRISILGKATVKSSGGGGVEDDAALAMSMTVEPNPFNASTSIRLTAPESGMLGIVVHDALGRLVFTSDVRHVGAGATESFSFDAQSLGLSNGVYYVTAMMGEREASRRIVFVK